jgi:hypothetical protein
MPTTLDRARFSASHFTLAFRTSAIPITGSTAYGLVVRRRSLRWYVERLYRGVTTPKPETDFGPPRLTPAEVPRVLKDDDLGFFLIDRDGIVRYAQGGPYVTLRGGKQVVGGPPANDEIVRELERCQPR